MGNVERYTLYLWEYGRSYYVGIGQAVDCIGISGGRSYNGGNVTTTKQERRLVRTRQKVPDFVRKAGPHNTPPKRTSRRAEIVAALNEWAEDYAGTHSIFED